jgi:uncharacterized protein
VKTVFADTGYWEAVLNPNDRLHERSQAASKALGKVRLITSEMVLSELLAALSKLPVREMAVAGVNRIRANPNVEVVRPCSLLMPMTITGSGWTRNGA